MRQTRSPHCAPPACRAAATSSRAARGSSGRTLTQALTARGCSVVGVDRFSDNYARAIKEGNLRRSSVGGDVEFHERDLAEAALEPLLEGVGGVFHLAARPGVRSSWGATFEHYLRDNILATQRVFEAAVKQGVRVVYASSSSVYGDAEAYPLREDAKPIPVSPYGVSKLSCEALATSYDRSLGLDAVGMRYFSVYGPRQRPDMAFSRVFDCMENDSPFRLLGNGRQSRDFTYVGDIVDATIAAMARGTTGGVYNVGGGSRDLAARRADALRASRGPQAPGRARRGGDRRRAPHDRRLRQGRRGARLEPEDDARGGAARAGRRSARPRAGRCARAARGPGARLTRRSASRPGGGLDVALVIQSFRPHVGGAELQLERLAPLLAQRGVRSEVITRAMKGAPRRGAHSRLDDPADAARRGVAARGPGVRRRGARAPAPASFPDRPRPRPRSAVPGDDRTRRPAARPALPRHGARGRPAGRPRAPGAQAARPPAVEAAVPLRRLRRAQHGAAPGADRARRAPGARPDAAERRRPDRLPAAPGPTSAAPCARASGCRARGSSAPSSAACTRSRTWTRCSTPRSGCRS